MPDDVADRDEQAGVAAEARPLRRATGIAVAVRPVRPPCGGGRSRGRGARRIAACADRRRRRDAAAGLIEHNVVEVVAAGLVAVRGRPVDVRPLQVRRGRWEQPCWTCDATAIASRRRVRSRRSCSMRSSASEKLAELAGAPRRSAAGEVAGADAVHERHERGSARSRAPRSAHRDDDRDEHRARPTRRRTPLWCGGRRRGSRLQLVASDDPHEVAVDRERRHAGVVVGAPCRVELPPRGRRPLAAGAVVRAEGGVERDVTGRPVRRSSAVRRGRAADAAARLRPPPPRPPSGSSGGRARRRRAS